MGLAFVACVEPGRLEAQALLLFRSIRRNAGRLRGARCVSLQPRAGDPLAAETLAGLRELDVEHVHQPLNRDFEHYPVANKLYALEWAERQLDADTLVFLDSDTFVCSEPGDLLLDDGVVAALRPVNRPNIGSTGPADDKDRYWRKVWSLCGVAPPPYVETAVDSVRIRAYWNAGLIAIRRPEGLAGRWMANFRALVAADCLPYNGLKNMDQVALAATLAAVPDGVRVLDPSYNYPLPKRAELPEPWRSAPLEDLVHVHYFRWFNRPGFLASLEPRLSSESDLVHWLSPQLPLLPIVEDATRKRRVDGAVTEAP